MEKFLCDDLKAFSDNKDYKVVLWISDINNGAGLIATSVSFRIDV